MACPLKFGRAKKTSKFGAISDNFRLWSRISYISGADPQIENRKSSWSTTTHPTLDEKKTVNFRPQTKKPLPCILTHPCGHFSVDYISVLRGCCALKFLHLLEIGHCYLAHTQTGTGVPEKNYNRENLKFGLKFNVCTSMTSGLMGISSQIFIQTTCRDLGVIMLVQFLDGLPLNIWDGEKRSKSCAISDNFRLWSWISPERIHKSKTENVVCQLQHLLHWAKKCWWTLVHKQKNYWRAYWPTEVDSVWETIFWPLQGDVPSIFLYALEIAEDLLMHTQTRTGFPPPKKKGW